MTEATTERELLQQFTAFRQTAQRLESVYADLKQRAARIDLELKETNVALERTLAERERILQALPVGVFRTGGRASQPENAAGERLRAELGGALWPDEPPAPGVVTEVACRDVAGRARSLRYQQVSLASGELLELVEDQTELAELQREVDRLDRIGSLAELSLGVAHEIRNPLNGLAGFAAMLRRDPKNPRAPDWACKIEEGARRVDRIVRDLLAFAAPGHGDDHTTRSLHEWLMEARGELPEVRLAASDRALRSKITGSARALGKVFANVVRNALEAGASEVRIDVGQVGAGRLQVVLEDDGCGVPAELADRVFDPFVSAKSDGTGLGLAFCARAMEAMDGRIRHEPSERGACFVLEIEGCLS